MKVFASQPFRHLGVDYPSGWLNLPDDLAIELKALWFVADKEYPLIIDQSVKNIGDSIETPDGLNGIEKRGNQLITGDGETTLVIPAVDAISAQSSMPILSNAQTMAAQGRYLAKDFDFGSLVITGLTSETIQLKPVFASRANVGASVGVLVRKADGTLVQATALGNGTYNIESLFCDYIDVVKSAAVESVTITGELRSNPVTPDPRTYQKNSVTAAAVGRFSTRVGKTAKLFISELSGETIQLKPVYEDDLDRGSSRGILVKDAAGTVTEALTLGNGYYTIDIVAYPYLEIVKSAAVGPVSILLEIE